MKTFVLSGIVALFLLGGVSYLLLDPLRSGARPGSRAAAIDAADAASSAASRDSGAAERSAGARRAREAARVRRELQRRPGADARGTTSALSSSEGEVEAAARGARPPLARGDSLLEVAVMDTSGMPLPEVEVMLRQGVAESRETTDEDGLALFGDIAAGAYEVRLRLVEGPEMVTARPVTVEAGESRALALRVAFSVQGISGRVLDRSGEPLPGIVVEARRYLFQAKENQVVPANDQVARAVTDVDGAYEIGGLLEGEYEIGTVATGLYPSVRKVVRSGVASCDLILDVARRVAIEGRVTDTQGKALPGVLVFPLGQPAQQTRSDPQGSYVVGLALGDERRVHTLRFSAQGYRDRYERLGPEDVDGAGSIALDVELEPVGETTRVEGLLVSSSGEPVAGETIYLHSPSLRARYAGVSASDGSFAIESVQVADDYRLWVQPKAEFKDFSRYPMGVPAGGIDLEIPLEPLGTGAVTGVIVDAEGRPLPGFRMWVRSARALGRWLEVGAGEDGSFAVDGVPAGELLFDTRSPPLLRAQGATLAADEVRDVRLVVDWGTSELMGVVTDDRGEPLPGARVELRWSRAEGPARSSSQRISTTDAAGRFRFSQLGPGSHHLNVSLAGYRPHRSTHDVGERERELEIELATDG